MKIRTDFVTNSSSSSFVIIYEVKEREDLFEIIKDKLGSVGVELCKQYFEKGYNSDIEYYLDEQFSTEKTYFKVTHYTTSDDPDDFINNSDKIFIEQNLSEFLTEIYNNED